jgi:tetratricopeptide (TPR) repeat protein
VLLGELALSVVGDFLTDSLRQAIKKLLPRPSDSLQDVLAEAFRLANQALLDSEGLSPDLQRITEQLIDSAARLFPPAPQGDGDPVLRALLVGDEHDLNVELARRVEPLLRWESDSQVLLGRLVPILISKVGHLLRDPRHREAWVEFQQVLLQSTIRAIGEQAQRKQFHNDSMLQLLDRLDRLLLDHDSLQELGDLLARTLSSIQADTARVSHATLREMIADAFEHQQATFDKLAAEIREPPEERIILSLPAQNRSFSGRNEEINSIRAPLTQTGSRGVRGLALWGLGGVGKTALALEYSHRYAGEYGLIWWVTATTPEAIAADLGRLAGKLGVRQSAQRDMLEELWGILSQRDSWLLVFDDADEPRGLRPFWPPRGSGHVLVTSRNPNWGNLAPAVRLDVLRPEEAVEFLDQRISSVDRDLPEALAHELGYLPLALEQAAAYLEQTGISLARYLRLWRRRAVEMYSRGRPSDYMETVATTWSVSMERVRDREPAAEDLLRLYAYLGPDVIPRYLPLLAPELLPDRLAEAASDELKYDDLVGALARYSLVAASASTLDVHRLVQGVVRKDLAPTDQRQWASVAARLVHACLPIGLDHVGDRRWTGLLAGHALAAAEHAEELGIELTTATLLVNNAALYMEDVGTYHRARDLFQWALNIGLRANNVDDRDLALIEKNLGSMLAKTGELNAARTTCEKALARASATAQPDDIRVARIANDLALVLDTLGEFQTAKAYLERSVNIWEAAAGPYHPELAITLGNLGMILHHLQDLDRAQSVLERALAMHETTGTDGSAALHNFATVQEDLGNHTDAHATLERVLAIEEKRYGPLHPEVANTLSTLARVVNATGDSEAAVRLQRRALETYVATLGRSHPKVADALTNLAAMLPLHDDRGGAMAMLEEAIHIYEIAGWHDRPELAQAFLILGQVCYQAGALEAARSWLERAVEALDRFSGGSPISFTHRKQLATALSQLAIAMIDIGDFERGDAQLRRVFELLEGSPRPTDRQGLAIALAEAARAKLELGDLPGARAAVEQALATYEPDSPGDHWLASNLSFLAMILIDMGQYEEARHALERALEVEEQAVESDLHAVGTLLSQLGLVLHHLGSLRDATEKMEWAAATFEAAGTPQGEDVITVSTALYRLGIALAEGQRFVEAEHRMRQALAMEQSHHGDRHPSVGMTLSLLGAVQYRIGKSTQARESLEHAISILEGSPSTDPFSLTLAFASLATVLRSIGLSRDGDEAAERAVQMIEQFSETLEQSVLALNLIGCRIVHLTGDLRQALEVLERALEALGRIEPNSFLFHLAFERTLGNLAAVMWKFREFDRPLAKWTQEYGPIWTFQATVGSNIATVLNPAVIRDPVSGPASSLGGWWGQVSEETTSDRRETDGTQESEAD